MTAPAAVDIAALKRRSPLAGVVEGSGITLSGRPGNRVRQGICPFHEETEGSFTVYADSQRWYCFGCGLGGDVLDFIQRLDGVGLPEAIRRLDSGAWQASAAPIESGPTQLASVRRDPQLLTAAMRFFTAQLRRSPEAERYLASRGIDLSASERLGLGFVPGQGLRPFLREVGFTDDRLDSSGLFSDRRERFRGMIVVPELIAGRVHWLAGRAIAPEARLRFQALPGPKPVLGLGNLHCPSEFVVVTEGLFDWLTLSSWGLPAVAALGTQGLDKVAHVLRGQPRVLIAFDSDEAGRAASAHLQGLLGNRRSRVVHLPDGVTDVADLGACPDGRDVFMHLLRRAATAR